MPGKLSGPNTHWKADPQALRKAAEGAVFLTLAIVVGIYGIHLFFRTSEAARRKVCRDNLQVIGISLQMYAQDYDGKLPPGGNSFALKMYRYIPEIRYLICPSDDLMQTRMRKKQQQQVRISYSYNPPPGRHADALYDATGTPLVWDRLGGIPAGAHEQGGNILYADGHARWRPAEIWAAADWPVWTRVNR